MLIKALHIHKLSIHQTTMFNMKVYSALLLCFTLTEIVAMNLILALILSQLYYSKTYNG